MATSSLTRSKDSNWETFLCSRGGAWWEAESGNPEVKGRGKWLRVPTSPPPRPLSLAAGVKLLEILAEHVHLSSGSFINIRWAGALAGGHGDLESSSMRWWLRDSGEERKTARGSERLQLYGRLSHT